MQVADFIKEKRKALKLTQPELASKAGVGLRFIRELEQGKQTLKMDKVNRVLLMFGYELGPVRQIKNYEIQVEPVNIKLDNGNISIDHKKKSK